MFRQGDPDSRRARSPIHRSWPQSNTRFLNRGSPRIVHRRLRPQTFRPHRVERHVIEERPLGRLARRDADRPQGDRRAASRASVPAESTSSPRASNSPRKYGRYVTGWYGLVLAFGFLRQLVKSSTLIVACSIRYIFTVVPVASSTPRVCFQDHVRRVRRDHEPGHVRCREPVLPTSSPPRCSAAGSAPACAGRSAPPSRSCCPASPAPARAPLLGDRQPPVVRQPQRVSDVGRARGVTTHRVCVGSSFHIGTGR